MERVEASDQQLQAVKANGVVAFANRDSDQPHPALGLAARGPDLGVEKEASPGPDRMAADSLQDCPRLFGIERQRLPPGDVAALRNAENAVNARRPGQRIVGKIAFPPAGAVTPEQV